MADIFLSYARKDAPRAAHLVRQLRAVGFDVWWDRDIGADQPWEATIERELGEARIVIVCWSTSAIQSENVRSEARWAKSHGKLVQLFLDKCDPPLFFGERQGISLAEDGAGDSAGLARLASQLRERLGPGSGPACHVAIENGADVASSGTSRRTLLAAGGGLCAIAAGGSGWWLWRARSLSSPDRRIAVQPFANLSGDPAQAYFSDGIAEELRSALAALPDLKVIGRTSSEKLRNDDAVDAARKLGVTNILTGSVRLSLHTIRITAQLIDGRTGDQRWSNSFDRPLGDVLAIESEVAHSVAQSLRITLGGGAAAIAAGGTLNPVAHDLYLKAKAQSVFVGDQDRAQESLALLDAAIALDPRYADAHILRAIMLSEFAGGIDASAEQSRADYIRAAESAQRAIKLAPDLAAGYAVFGAILADQLHIKSALIQYRIAAALPEDEGFLRSYSKFLSQLARYGDALALANKAITLDPLNDLALLNKAWIVFLTGDFSQCLAIAQSVLAKSAKLLDASWLVGLSLQSLGRLREALTVVQQQPVDSVYRLTSEAIIKFHLGDRAGSDSALARLGQVGGDADNFQLAQVRAQRGETDRAFAALDRAWLLRDPGMLDLRGDAWLKPLRADPRFDALVLKLDYP